MSGLHLPPAEPPDEELAEHRAALEWIRGELRFAEHTLRMIDVGAEDHDDAPGSLHAIRQDVERQLAQQRVEFWRGVLAERVADAIRAGLNS